MLGRDVTAVAGGTNFAPPRGLHCALRARADGPTLQQVGAQFESNHEALCDLASPAAAWISGAIVPVDGGRLARGLDLPAGED